MSGTDADPVRPDLAALRIDRSQPPKPNRRTAILVTLGAAVLVALGGALVWLQSTDGPAVEVGYATLSGIEETTAGSVLSGSGYIVTADRYVSLGARVPGRIEAYLVDEGDEVKEGQALVRLDARPFEVGLRRAEASLELARANRDLGEKELARLQELRRRNVSSQSELDIKENQLRVAQAEIARYEAEIAQVRLDLEDTVLRAPTNGVVLDKLKEVGEIATPGGFAGSGDLIRMANLDELRAEVDVSETDLARVALGQPADVVPDAYSDRRYAARVVKLAPRINRQKGTLEVEVLVLEPDTWLRPDMSVRVTFLEELRAAGSDAPPVVLAPPAALRSDASGAYVWAVTRGRLRRIAVETAGRSGGRVVVTSGLAGGEQLVLGDGKGLAEDMRVQVREGG